MTLWAKEDMLYVSELLVLAFNINFVGHQSIPSMVNTQDYVWGWVIDQIYRAISLLCVQ